MELLRKLEWLQENLIQVKENVGDGWGDFAAKFYNAHDAVKKKQFEEAEQKLSLLFRETEYLRGFTDGAVRTRGSSRRVRVRGAKSTISQMSNREKEQLLMQRMQKIHTEIKKIESNR